MAEILFKEESYQIMGACFEVYREMGPGFLESVYQECLELEFTAREIPFQVKPILSLKYKTHELQQRYIPDLICYGSIILEIKALKQICHEHRAQVHNYLKSTGFRLGLLVNFGHAPKLEYERIVC